MKTKKLFIIIATIIAVLFILTACDGESFYYGENDSIKQNAAAERTSVISPQPNDSAIEEHGDFYSLGEVYESGEITRQDLLSMIYYYYGYIIRENKEQYPEDFAPTPKYPAELDDETKREIENAYQNKFKKENEKLYSDVIAEAEYFGTYNDYICVEINIIIPGVGVGEVVWKINVDGVSYWEAPNYTLQLYKRRTDTGSAGQSADTGSSVEQSQSTDGETIYSEEGSANEDKKIYTVAELYKSGEITKQDLLDIAYYENGGIIEENINLYPDDYVPKTFQPEELDEKTEEEIVAALKAEREQDYIEIKGYVGTYNDYIAVWYMDGSTYIAIEPIKSYGKIDGVTFVFWYPSSTQLAFYKNK